MNFVDSLRCQLSILLCMNVVLSTACHLSGEALLIDEALERLVQQDALLLFEVS